MNGYALLGRLAGMIALSFAAWLPPFSLTAAEANITQTNWSERWITNVIEVTMPVNRFVNEYRTNWIPQTRTNIVEAYATNWHMVTVTNPVTVKGFWTNYVTAYKTNLITRTRTNSVAVSLVRTNVLNAYHTNWSTLNFTNWVTVIMFKTNWVTQPVTNVVPIDLPSRSAMILSTPAGPAPAKEPAMTSTPTARGKPIAPVAILAARTTRPPANNLVEVRLKARWAGNGTTPLQVESWRIEREDGAVFLFGQEQEFVRQLPVGSYSVEARLRGDKAGPLYIARGTLSVTAQDAIIHQQLLARK